MKWEAWCGKSEPVEVKRLPAGVEGFVSDRCVEAIAIGIAVIVAWMEAPCIPPRGQGEVQAAWALLVPKRLPLPEVELRVTREE